MADINWDDVTAIAPELASFDATAQDFILEFVNDSFDSRDWKASALKLARIYLAAHVATISNQGGDLTAGPVISETVGGISRTYANVMTGVAFSGSTYADMLNLLISQSLARLPKVI